MGELWLILRRIYGNTSQSSALHWWHNTQLTLTGYSVQRQQLWDVQTFRDILGHFPSDFWKFGSFHFKQKRASPRFHCHFLFLFKENRTATLHTPLRKLSLQNSRCDVKDKTKLHLYKSIEIYLVNILCLRCKSRWVFFYSANVSFASKQPNLLVV